MQIGQNITLSVVFHFLCVEGFEFKLDVNVSVRFGTNSFLMFRKFLSKWGVPQSKIYNMSEQILRKNIRKALNNTDDLQ